MSVELLVCHLKISSIETTKEQGFLQLLPKWEYLVYSRGHSGILEIDIVSKMKGTTYRKRVFAGICGRNKYKIHPYDMM